MRPALILGASRGTGLELAYQLRRQGRRVVALVRPRSQAHALEAMGVESLRGDASSRDDVTQAFRRLGPGGDVISTLSGRLPEGGHIDDTGNRTVVDAAMDASPARLVLVTSIGCGEMLPFRSARAIAAFGDVVEAKTRAEEHLRASGLPFTILRPGGLKSEPATGGGILSTDPAIHGFIHRADLAALVAAVLDDPATQGRAYAAVDLDQARCANPIEPVALHQP